MTDLIEVLLSSVIAGLVTFVLASFLMEQEGPWDLFKHIRKSLKVYEEKYDDQTDQWYDLDGTGFFAKLFACIWCLSTWVSALVCLVIVIVFKQPFYFWPFEWIASVAVSGKVYIFKE